MTTDGAVIGAMVLILILWVILTFLDRDGWLRAGAGFWRNVARFLLMMACEPLILVFPAMIIVGPLFGVAALGDVVFSWFGGHKSDPQSASILSFIVLYFVSFIPAAFCLGWLSSTSEEG